MKPEKPELSKLTYYETQQKSSCKRQPKDNLHPNGDSTLGERVAAAKIASRSV